MRSIIFLLLLASPALAQPNYSASQMRDNSVSGHARIMDGDTLQIGAVKVRLSGLHAPELAEPGGPEAKAWMIARTRGQIVTCTLDGSRTRNRWAGTCYVAGSDLAAGLIEAGLGRDCERYSKGRYRHLETPAGRAMPLPAYCRP